MDRTFHPTFSLKYFDGEKIQDIELAKVTGEVYELEEEVAGITAAARGAELCCANGNDGRWAVALCMKAQESVDTSQVIKF